MEEKLNSNTFKSAFNYLQLTKKSNNINTWLLGINTAILLFIINIYIKPSDIFLKMNQEIFYFKISNLFLFTWIAINMVILIIYTYKERVLSLIIEEKFFRLKSFISFMDSVIDINEKELMDTDMFYVGDLASKVSTKKVLEDYANKIIKYQSTLVKWSNKRLIIYRFVILSALPLIINFVIIVLFYYGWI